MVMAARAFIGNNESRLARGSVNAMRWRREDGTWAATSPLAVGIPLVSTAYPLLNPTSAVGRRSVTDAQRGDDSKALQLARNGQECCEDSGLFALKTQVRIL